MMLNKYYKGFWKIVLKISVKNKLIIIYAQNLPLDIKI